MTITFPRLLYPVAYTSNSTLELIRSISQSRSGNRMTNIIEYADPVWLADLETRPLTEDEYRGLQIWHASFREGLRTCLFRRPGYIKDTVAYSDSGVISSITSGNVLSITSVNSGLSLTQGDYITLLTSGGIRMLVMVDEATGSGTSRTVTVEPIVPSEFVNATAMFDRAELLMRPIAGTLQRTKGKVESATFQMIESRT